MSRKVFVVKEVDIFRIRFEERDKVCPTWAKISCGSIWFSEDNPYVFYADGVMVELEGRIVKVEKYVLDKMDFVEIKKNLVYEGIVSKIKH